jgi:acetyl esterase/lipase
MLGIKLVKHNKKSELITSEEVSYGKNRKQRYDVHTPKNVENPPTVFYIHGGSWMSIDKSYYNYALKTLAESGYRVVNINYRLLPRYTLTDVLNDSESAIVHAIQNIKGIDTSRLLIAGDSAGAHLAALISAKANSGAFRAKISFMGAAFFYGIFDMSDMLADDACWLFKFLTKYFKMENGPDYKEYIMSMSPSRYFSLNFPPCFIASGAVDPLHPATLTFIKQLENNGIKHVPYILGPDRKDGLHGFLSYTFMESSKEALKLWIDFFDSLTK